MGADGSIYIVKKEKFQKEFPDITAHFFGCYSGEILGVPAIWTYRGEPYYEAPYEFEDKIENSFYVKWAAEKNNVPVERIVEAVKWFEGNAESHEVWT